MEGIVAWWDAHSHLLVSQGVAHTRPVSHVQFSPDGQVLASTSWDRQVALRFPARERDNRAFTAHNDIVSGCRFTPDGKQLLTWSHDCTVRLWDLERTSLQMSFEGHSDRVSSGDISPDGSLAVTGSRNGEVFLWDIDARAKLHTLKLKEDIRACLFLLDGESLVTVEASGRMELHSIPDLQTHVELGLRAPAQCAALSPRGDQLAVGGEDGLVRFVTVEGQDSPLFVTVTQSVRTTASRFQKLFGRSSTTNVYSCVCPACRNSVEFLNTLPSQPAPCPHCRRPLRFSRKALLATV
jgi:WD40 repeat protein